MRIRTQLRLLLSVFSVALLVIAVSAIITTLRADQAVEQGRLAAAVHEGASELSYLSNDYLIYREPQQRTRWLTKYAAVSQQAAGLRATDPEAQALVTSVQESTRRVKEVFDSIDAGVMTPATASAAATPPDGPPDPAQLQIAWSRMGMQTQSLMTDAERLADLLADDADRALAIRTALTYAMIGVFALFFLMNYVTVQRRVIRSLATLREGATVIGAGNLDHRIPVERRGGDVDEIGELSAAFNAMAASLKRDLTHRQLAEAALEESRAQLQAYARRLVDASESERRMIARELHDEAGQVMTALRLSLARLQRKADPELAARLEELQQLADRVIDDLRKLAADLRPGSLDLGGLAPALEQHIAQFRQRTGLHVTFAAHDLQGHRLPPEVETNLYRIAQEALTNAARYAKATHIEVRLECHAHEVMLAVLDDGVGFDVDEAQRKNHLGLLGMRERAAALGGRLVIESSPGRGARIWVAAPLD